MINTLGPSTLRRFTFFLIRSVRFTRRTNLAMMVRGLLVWRFPGSRWATLMSLASMSTPAFCASWTTCWRVSSLSVSGRPWIFTFSRRVYCSSSSLRNVSTCTCRFNSSVASVVFLVSSLQYASDMVVTALIRIGSGAPITWAIIPPMSVALSPDNFTDPDRRFKEEYSPYT